MTTDTMSFAGSGMIFNNTFTANVTQPYMDCILSAEQMIASEFTNSITINVEFDAQALGTNTYFATNRIGPGAGMVVSYSTYKNALESLASYEPNNSIFQQAVANLPATDPSGGAGFVLPQPYAELLGLSTASGNPDQIITLNTSFNWSYGQDVIHAMEHEISEGGMGRFGGLGDQQGSHWAPMDLFRYNASGVRDYTDGRDGQAAYFSYDGGATLSSSAGLSFNNEYSGGLKVNSVDVADFNELDVFGHGGPGSTDDTLSPTDIAILEALGWTTSPTPTFPFTGDAMSQIETIYIGYFGRAGDPSGTSYWTNQLLNGGSTVQTMTGIAASYSVQPESQAQYPFLANPLSATTSGAGNQLDQFINSVYQNLFGRAADGTDTSGGLGFWRGQILNVLATHDSTALANELGSFILQVAYGAQGQDQTVLANKVSVADAITQTFAAHNIHFGNDGSAADQFAHTDIASVTASAASVNAAEVAIVGIIHSLI